MRYINLHFTYLLTYLATKANNYDLVFCDAVQSAILAKLGFLLYKDFQCYLARSTWFLLSFMTTGTRARVICYYIPIAGTLIPAQSNIIPRSF